MDPAVQPLHPVTLTGDVVQLQPLSVNHLDGLCRIGLDEALWRWMPVQVRSREQMAAYIAEALVEQQRGKQLPFALVERASLKPIGSTRYGNIDLAHRRVEIGWTWIAQPWQRTAVNTEAKFLLLRHAFESLKCNRVELKTDALNERSRAAILRIGAKEEGTFRQHMVMDTGRIRDTVYFSIVQSEWPEVKARLAARLGRDPQSA